VTRDFTESPRTVKFFFRSEPTLPTIIGPVFESGSALSISPVNLVKAVAIQSREQLPRDMPQRRGSPAVRDSRNAHHRITDVFVHKTAIVQNKIRDRREITIHHLHQSSGKSFSDKSVKPARSEKKMVNSFFSPPNLIASGFFRSFSTTCFEHSCQNSLNLAFALALAPKIVRHARQQAYSDADGRQRGRKK